MEVGLRFARPWRAFFYRLERIHLLDHHNPHHLWLLHHLFLTEISASCAEFCEEWNAHPISGEGHNQSPNVSAVTIIQPSCVYNKYTPQDMRFTGHLKHGFYVQNELTLHPDVLAHYYGSGSTSQSQQSQTEINSNGQNSDEEWEDVEDIEAGSVPYTELPLLIAEEQASQFLHKAAKVPKHINPFDHEDLENVFKQALDEVKRLNHMPFELGVREEEWGNEGYPEIEIIPSSHRRNKELVVELPHFVWYPWAVYWCQALEVLGHTLALVD